MPHDAEENGRHADPDFSQEIAAKARQRRRGRHKDDRSVWRALGAFGMVGWSVAVPTLIGVLLGAWLDAVWTTTPVPWTLVLLLTGLTIGCVSAWQWIEQERHDIQKDREEMQNG